MRNTPTGVGKTTTGSESFPQEEKHPHGRGEDENGRSQTRRTDETPPRAWGRHLHDNLSHLIRRNTPTGVGKTWPRCARSTPFRKHPHGRGEDQNALMDIVTSVETPPRAWGRQSRGRQCPGDDGNTPTGVGKTATYWAFKYLNHNILFK